MTRDVTTLIINKLAEYGEHNACPLVVDESTAIAQLNLDSLSLVEAIFELEQELNVTLDAADLKTLQCVGDIVQAVNRARLAAV